METGRLTQAGDLDVSTAAVACVVAGAARAGAVGVVGAWQRGYAKQVQGRKRGKNL
jgi:hypothetical protein